MSALVKNQKGLVLYAIAYHQVLRGREKVDFEYAHASDVASARYQFYTIKRPGRIRVLEIAPAVGFSCDEHGENLVV